MTARADQANRVRRRTALAAGSMVFSAGAYNGEMAFLDWLLHGPGYQRFADTYSLSREAVYNGLCRAIESQTQHGGNVIALCHFPQTFTRLQAVLDETGMDYEVISQRVSSRLLRSYLEKSPQTPLKLTMAPMLQPDTSNHPVSRSGQLALIVAERHPRIDYDQRLEQFAKQLPFRVHLGYFLSLEDPVVRRFISPATIEILRQLGLQENELITSAMVTRRLNIVLGRMKKQYRTDHPADSPEQWFELNDPARTER